MRSKIVIRYIKKKEENKLIFKILFGILILKRIY